MATLNCKKCGMIHPVCDPCEGPRKPRTCTTHHHACDCREREFEKIREQRDELLAACELALVYMQCQDIRNVTRTRIEEAVKKAKGNQ
jgi:hypothetical protein